MPAQPDHIYHILPAAEARRILGQPAYRPPSLRDQGFIHAAANPEQALRVANRLFRQHPSVSVLCIARSRVQAEVCDERAAGDPDAFPHIYGPLNTDALVTTVDLVQDASGAFTRFPSLAPEPSLAERVQRMLGRGAITWTPVTRGYTPAARWIARFENGRSAFVKAAAGDLTAQWLRAERQVYASVRGEFLPQMLGWDDSARPVLLLEDLSSGTWPPPWSTRKLHAMLETLAKVQSATPPANLPPLDRAALRGWSLIAEDPQPFLSLSLCSEDWLRHALPALVESERSAPLEGAELIHLDVRSDNVCLLKDRVVLVDWNHACRANGLFDTAAWLPSLQAEGGPPPEEVAPEASVFAGLLSGFFAARAGLPPIRGAPRVRHVQLQQLRTALPWAVRALGLPPLQ
jgi:uncharacterized protein (DUF952 family)